MQINIEQLEKLSNDEYVLFDMRPETDRAYGFIPDSVSVTEEELRENPPADKSKKIVVYCAKGILSVDVVEWLCEQGYDAYSLEDGYFAWLRRQMQKQVDDDFCAKVEQSLRKKFKSDIFGKFIKAIKEYDLIHDGDTIAVCISGGKDSMLMAKLFQELQSHGRQNFEVVYLVMNPGYNQLNAQAVLDNARLLGIPIEVFHTEIFDIVANQGGSPCYLCARMRRGYLYKYAGELGCNKIALGHHFDDAVETMLMNLLFEGRIGCFQPVTYLDRSGITQIRPLLYQLFRIQLRIFSHKFLNLPSQISTNRR